MSDEVEKRLNAASVLSSAFPPHPDSAYLLDLIAFELLLKATVRIHASGPVQGHCYPELFAKLPVAVRSRVLEVASDRMTTAADYSDLQGLLKVWSRNFVDMRYPYEKYEGMTEQQYRVRGADWLARGAPTAEADFACYPSELNGMIVALQAEVRGWLESAST
jgi:hypothetical protein